MLCYRIKLLTKCIFLSVLQFFKVRFQFHTNFFPCILCSIPVFVYVLCLVPQNRPLLHQKKLAVQCQSQSPRPSLRTQPHATDARRRLKSSHVKALIGCCTPLTHGHGTTTVCCSECSRAQHGSRPVIVSCESSHSLLCATGKTIFPVTIKIVSCERGLTYTGRQKSGCSLL